MKKLVLIDNNGKEYFVKDPQKFYDHLIDFHSNKNTGDHSVHEENGFYFTVNESFFQKIENFVLNFKS